MRIAVFSTRRANSSPVHRPPLRDNLGTFRFYEGKFVRSGGAKTAKHPDNTLSRRLADYGSFSGAAQQSPVRNFFSTSGTRVANKLGKSCIIPSTKAKFLGFVLDSRAMVLSLSLKRQEKLQAAISLLSKQRWTNCQNRHESPRSYDFNDRSHTLGSLASKTTAVGNSEPVGSQSTPAEQEMLVKSQSSAFPQVVESLHSGVINDRTKMDPPDN